ncbi:MAG: helix-turn-helix domain-containing protein [Candidatus Paceibacterota bacterium]
MLAEREFEEFADRLVERLVTELRGKVDLTNQLVGREEMAKTLGVSLQTLDRLVNAKAIPSVKLGGSRRFDRQAVLETLKNAEGVSHE